MRDEIRVRAMGDEALVDRVQYPDEDDLSVIIRDRRERMRRLNGLTKAFSTPLSLWYRYTRLQLRWSLRSRETHVEVVI